MRISEKNNVLCQEQYGFRSKHITKLATIKLDDYLLMYDNQIQDTIYLGPSKSFDTLNFVIC